MKERERERKGESEGERERIQAFCSRRFRAFSCDPGPRGRVFTAALSGEGDLALDPTALLPVDCPPSCPLCSASSTITHPFPSPSLPPSLLPLRGHSLITVEFSPSLHVSPHPSVWPSRESLIFSLLQIFHTFPAWDANASSVRLAVAPSPPSQQHPRSHSNKVCHVAPLLLTPSYFTSEETGRSLN